MIGSLLAWAVELSDLPKPVFGLLLLGLILLIVVPLALFLRRRIGCICICGRRMSFFRELDHGSQSEIVEYFRTVERREVRAADIFVCRPCGFVYDEFAGERRSMEADCLFVCKVCGKPTVRHMGLFMTSPAFVEARRKLREKSSRFMAAIECLRCERGPRTDAECILCDTNPKAMACTSCSAIYTWSDMGKMRFKFLVPLTDEEILDKVSYPMADTF